MWRIGQQSVHKCTIFIERLAYCPLKSIDLQFLRCVCMREGDAMLRLEVNRLQWTIRVPVLLTCRA